MSNGNFKERFNRLRTQSRIREYDLAKKITQLQAELETSRELSDMRYRSEQRYREALEKAMEKQPEALAICRKEKFVFDDKGGRWEKLAFTFYTDLCEIHSLAEEALHPVGTEGPECCRDKTHQGPCDKEHPKRSCICNSYPERSEVPYTGDPITGEDY